RTFALLGSGETTGMFQLESAGMRRYVRELKPDRVEDIMAMVALFRPGPMDYIPTYIKRKHGEEPVTYAHPTLEPVLRATYGVMVYQEDVMAVTQALAGFTLAEADVLCYAVRKKFRDKLDAQKVKFVSGAVRNGVHADVIEALSTPGAGDEFGPRLWQLDRLDQVLEPAQRLQRDRESGQVGLCAELGMSGQLDVKFGAGPHSRFVGGPKEQLAWEKELLG